METIKNFKEMLKSDENLNVEYKKLVVSKNSDAIISFMKNNGVSVEDIKDLANRELSDDELDRVTGGFSWSDLWNTLLSKSPCAQCPNAKCPDCPTKS